MRSLLIPLGVLLGLALAGCDPEPGTLVVQLRTDWVPGQEFTAVRTGLYRTLPTGEETPLMRGDASAVFGEDYVGGLRVAELTGLARGDYFVQSRMLRADGSLLADRVVGVELRGSSFAVTVVASRSCAGVTCPGAGDPPDAIACSGGDCVPVGCSPETPEACGMAVGCAANADCPSMARCSAGACVDGVCFERATDGACDADQWCDPEAGCRELASVDAGAPDAAVADAGEPDAGRLDAGPPAADAGAADAGSSASRCAPVDPQTVALFRFDTPGPMFNDEAGANAAMTFGGAVTSSAAPHPSCGAAINFPPSGSVYIRIEDGPVWDLTEGSVDLWFRYDDAFPGHFGVLSRDASGLSMPGHLNISVARDRSLFVRLQGASAEGVRCSAPLTGGVWHHVGVNFGPGGLELWVDGAIVSRPGMLLIDEPPTFPFSLPCDTSTPDGIDGNDLFWVVGANNGYSTDFTADSIRSFLRNGGIDHLRVSRVRRDFSAFMP